MIKEIQVADAWTHESKMKINFLLQPNTVCRIISLGVNPKVIKRLAQRGILPGMEVTIVRVGPLGDPLELAVTQGQNIALRREEAESLDCEVIALPLTAANPRASRGHWFPTQDGRPWPGRGCGDAEKLLLEPAN